MIQIEIGKSKLKKWKIFGRNPKCDRDWIKVLKTYWKHIENVIEIKFQRGKGNKSPKRKLKVNEAFKKIAIPKTTM